MKNILLFFFLLSLCSGAFAQSIYYVRQDVGNAEYFLSLYNVQTCQNTDVSPIDFSNFNTPTVLDLAITPLGEFYFLIATVDIFSGNFLDPHLVKLNVATNTTSSVTALPYTCNSLVCDANNILYAAGEGLYTHNISTNTGQDHGPLSFIPSGDLTILDDKLYCASYFPTNHLMQININNPAASTSFVNYTLPSATYVWGIVSIPVSCDSTSIFFTSAQVLGIGPSEVYQFNLDNASLTYLCTSQEQITGFTSPEEFNSFDCAIRLNLDSDASSGAPLTDWQTLPLCSSDNLPVADTDATYYSGYFTDSIRLRLLAPTPDAPLEYLTATPSAAIAVGGQGTGWLTLTATGSTTLTVANANYQDVLRTARWHDDAMPITPGLRTVEVIAFASGGHGDTSYAYLPIVSQLLAGIDTAFEVCANTPPFALFVPGSTPGGIWSPMLTGGIFSPQDHLPGTFSYTIGGGFCPADTAFVTVNVLPLPSFSLGQDLEVCSNQFPFPINAPGIVRWQDGNISSSFIVTEPGVYWAELSNAAGCQFRDSIMVLPSPVYSTVEYAQPCMGAPYLWNGQLLAVDTVVCLNYIALNGCDSTHCLSLTFFSPEQALDTVICGNQTLHWLNQEYTASGIYADTVLLGNCLTATLLHLSVIPLDTISQSASLCYGETFTLGGQTFSASGQYFVALQSSVGCDTIFSLDLTVQPLAQSTLAATICPGTAYVFNGNTLSVPGTYTSTGKTIGGCDSTVTLTLNQFSMLSPQILGDTNFCNGGSVTLSTGSFSVYQWSGGESTASLSTSSGGIYALTVTDMQGCTASTAVTVTELPPFAVEWFTGNPLCYGESTGFAGLTGITGGVEPLTFQLNNAVPTAMPVFDALPAGNWEIQATDAEGCTSTFSFSLSDPPELTVELGPSQVLEYGDLYPIPVEINQSGVFDFSWTPATWLDCSDCPGPVATAIEDITYTLVLTDSDGCEASDNLSLKVLKGTGKVYIPNVISPNEDGSNDAFTVFGDPNLVRAIELLRVYDRWGELLFESKTSGLNHEPSGWNGEQRGRPVLPGVYVWYAEIRLMDDTLLQKSGDVTVVR